jgi:hypothetical protein
MQDSGLQPGVGVKTCYGACEIRNIQFRDKHRIIRARFRVSHRRPGRRDRSEPH